MKTPYLLGIITVLLFGSFAMSGMFVQAGLEDLEVIQVIGNHACDSTNDACQILGLFPTSTALCPSTHKLIGGGISEFDIRYGDNDVTTSGFLYRMNEQPNFLTNHFRVSNDQVSSFSGDLLVEYTAYAMCAKINFPMDGMSMIGGELLDLDTMSLFIGAIGVNPVITGLVAITMGGVAAQAIWFVNSKRVKKVE